MAHTWSDKKKITLQRGDELKSLFKIRFDFLYLSLETFLVNVTMEKLLFSFQ